MAWYLRTWHDRHHASEPNPFPTKERVLHTVATIGPFMRIVINSAHKVEDFRQRLLGALNGASARDVRDVLSGASANGDAGEVRHFGRIVPILASVMPPAADETSDELRPNNTLNSMTSWGPTRPRGWYLPVTWLRRGCESNYPRCDGDRN